MIYSINFKFDDTVRQVYDVEVQLDGVVESPISEEILEMTGSSLQLTAGVLKDLQAVRQGTRVALVIEPGDVVKLVNPKLYPVPTEGAILSKKWALPIRGKNKDKLQTIGQAFKYQRLEVGVVKLIPCPAPVKVEVNVGTTSPVEVIDLKASDEEE